MGASGDIQDRGEVVQNSDPTPPQQRDDIDDQIRGRWIPGMPREDLQKVQQAIDAGYSMSSTALKNRRKRERRKNSAVDAEHAAVERWRRYENHLDQLLMLSGPKSDQRETPPGLQGTQYLAPPPPGLASSQQPLSNSVVGLSKDEQASRAPRTVPPGFSPFLRQTKKPDHPPGFSPTPHNTPIRKFLPPGPIPSSSGYSAAVSKLADLGFTSGNLYAPVPGAGDNIPAYGAVDPSSVARNPAATPVEENGAVARPAPVYVSSAGYRLRL